MPITSVMRQLSSEFQWKIQKREGSSSGDVVWISLKRSTVEVHTRLDSVVAEVEGERLWSTSSRHGKKAIAKKKKRVACDSDPQYCSVLEGDGVWAGCSGRWFVEIRDRVELREGLGE